MVFLVATAFDPRRIASMRSRNESSNRNFSYAAKIDGVCFDELKHACFIFCTACLERDGGNVLSGKDPSRRSFHTLFDSRDQRFLQKVAVSREKLHRPAGNDNMFAFHGAATVAKVREDRLQTYQAGAWLGAEFNEDIHIEGGDRFQIKCRPNSTADGIAFNHTVGFHPINNLDRFFYRHRRRISLKPDLKKIRK